MKTFSRRDMLKTSLLAPAAMVTTQGHGSVESAMNAVREVSGPLTASMQTASATPGAGRERLLLDFGWRFHLGDSCDASKDFDYSTPEAGNFQKTGNFMPAAGASFDDGDWRSVDLPHDWAVELPFKNDSGLQSKGFYPLGRKYPETSVGWYRRIFELAPEDAGKRVVIEFDGAYRETMVVFNGFYIGQYSGGYDPFSFDVTDFVNAGEGPRGRNVLLVRVDATESDGWFYEGAGIYRHVWLVKTHPVHVRQWGTLVKPEIRPGEATLSILTELANDGDSPAAKVRVVSTIVDAAGKAVVRDVAAAGEIGIREQRDYRQEISVSRPKLWSLEERNLYKLLTEVQVDGQTVDRYETPFGIRSVVYDATKGLLINGEQVPVKGTCNHQDHAGIGAALPDSVQWYRVRTLKEMGCNSLRTSHNPPTPELLDACDQLGMLVNDETRMMSSNPEGLSQFENLVRRDRNHPSVFMWSLGNEEAQALTEKGTAIITAMKEIATKHDGSRPTTIDGSIDGDKNSGVGGLAVADVIGYHYADPQAAAFHKAHPERPVLGTETVSAVGTRGIYITDKSKGFVASYDPYTTTGRASAEGWWRFVAANPWVSGGFVWTGFDYRGEPSPNGWPNVSSQYGVIDMCGFPKDTYYYYQAWWTEKPTLHLFPHWNWPGYEGKEIAVWVYSNLDKVELLVNGESLGSKDVKKNEHVAWRVKYAPGSIEARGWKDGKQVMTTRRDTVGAAAKLVVRADRDTVSADGEDVAMFAVEVQDAQGRTVPITDNLVTFSVTGPAKVIGVGNGDPTDQSPDKASARKAFCGYCMAVVQSAKTAGTITVEASAPGLSGDKATIASKAVELRPQVAVWERPVPKGAGVTGLWRVVPNPNPGMFEGFIGGPQIVTLIEDGGKLTGNVEGPGGFFGGDGSPEPITDGTANGDHVAFKYGINVFEGTVKGDRMELQRRISIPFQMPSPSKDANPPAIGPAPDGSDPSFDFSGDFPTSLPVVLKKAER